MRKQSVIRSDFYCTKCGYYFPIFRKTAKQKEPGHLKALFCPECKRVVNFVEIKEMGSYTIRDFWLEQTFQNFDKNGTRKEPYKQFIHNLEERGVYIGSKTKKEDSGDK